MEIIKNQKVNYVVIEGYGAGVGIASKVLANGCLKVAALEAESFFDPANPQQQTQLNWPYEFPRIGVSNRIPFGDIDTAYGGWEILEERSIEKEICNFIGFDHEFLEEGRIIVEEFPCGLASVILR